MMTEYQASIRLKGSYIFRIYSHKCPKNVIFSPLSTCLAWFSPWNTYFYHFIWDFVYVCYIETHIMPWSGYRLGLSDRIQEIFILVM